MEGGEDPQGAPPGLGGMNLGGERMIRGLGPSLKACRTMLSNGIATGSCGCLKFFAVFLN